MPNEYSLRQWALDKALEAHRHVTTPTDVKAAEIVATAGAFLVFAQESDKPSQ